MKQVRLALFCSGEGTNLQAILEAIRTGRISAKLAFVLSDNPKAYCLTRASLAGISAILLDPQKFSSHTEFDQELLTQLSNHKVDWVILAGYMRILGPAIVQAYHSRILNIHPALLPVFKGADAIRKALEYGVKVTGVTVHIVDEETDHGPIVLQEAVEILPSDTLESLTQKIHTIEHQLYPKAIQLAIEGKLRVEGRKVRILQ